MLIQNGADVNAATYEEKTALYLAIRASRPEVAEIVLQLLCFGAEIHKKTIDASNEPEFPQPLHDVLISLRDGIGTKTTFMSNEERRFMWNLGFVLAVKHRAIAFRTYHVFSFITTTVFSWGPI